MEALSIKAGQEGSNLAAPSSWSRAKSSSRKHLTPREREILYWIGLGKRNREIAVILGISIRTVEKHVQNVLDKLGAENRTAAASWKMRLS